MCTPADVITCKAAVAYGPKQPLVVEDIQVRGGSLAKVITALRPPPAVVVFTKQSVYASQRRECEPRYGSP